MSKKAIVPPTASPTPSEDDVAVTAPKVPRAFGILFGMVGLLGLFVISPYWVPLFLGATVSATLGPIQKRLSSLLRGRRAMAAALITLSLLLLVIAPLASLILYGSQEMAEGVAWARQLAQLDNLKAVSHGRLPQALHQTVERALADLPFGADEVGQAGQSLIEVMQKSSAAIFGASMGFVGNLLLMLISCFFMLNEGPALMDTILRNTPMRRMHTREIFNDFYAVASASLIGMGFTAVGQSLVLTLGFFVAGLPHLFFFAVMTLLGAFVPLLGTMIVWVPTAAGLALAGRTGAAIGLTIWSLVSVNIVDAGLKPLVLKGRMPLHGGLTFLGMLGGLGVFGPVGVIAGPLVLALFASFLRMYERDYLPGSQTATKTALR